MDLSLLGALKPGLCFLGAHSLVGEEDTCKTPASCQVRILVQWWWNRVLWNAEGRMGMTLGKAGTVKAECKLWRPET